MHLSRRVRGRLAAIAAVTIVSLASAAAAPAPRAAPAARPPALLVTVALGPASALDGTRAFSDAIWPGMSGVITDVLLDHALANLVTLPPLDAFDATAPRYILVVDRDGVPGAALVGKVGDPTDLAARAIGRTVAQRDGWAVLGPADVVAEIGDYALTHLPGQAAATRPSATLYLGDALARHQGDVAAWRARLAAPLLAQGRDQANVDAVLDGLRAILDDSERITITLDAGADALSLDVALVPRRGSPLAAFTAAQRPSDFGLLARLPDETAEGLVAGHIEGGERWLDAAWKLVAGTNGPIGREALAPDVRKLRRATTGDVAGQFFFTTSGVATTMVFGVADARAADAAAAHLFELSQTPRVTTSGVTTSTWRALPQPTTHDGVTIRSFEDAVDLTGLDPHRRAWFIGIFGDTIHRDIALFDRLGVVAAGADAADRTEHAIDAARHGNGYRPTPAFQALLDAARARKDSAVLTIDVGEIGKATGGAPRLGPRAASFSLGFTDGAMHARVTFTAGALSRIGAHP